MKSRFAMLASALCCQCSIGYAATQIATLSCRRDLRCLPDRGQECALRGRMRDQGSRTGQA